MNRIFIYSTFILALTYACSSENKPAEKQEVDQQEEQSVQEIDKDWEELSVVDGGFKLLMEVPSEKLAHGNSKVTFHDDLGELEINVGPGFDLFLMEDESQFEMRKNELTNHPFYKVEFKEMTDSTLFYRLYTADGSKDQWQIYVERHIGPSVILIRSNDAIPFSEYEAKLMYKSALSTSPII
jgi:hypothetical protein